MRPRGATGVEIFSSRAYLLVGDSEHVCERESMYV